MGIAVSQQVDNSFKIPRGKGLKCQLQVSVEVSNM